MHVSIAGVQDPKKPCNANVRESAPVDLNSLGDGELLMLIARRYEPALGVLYDRYGRLVFAIALRVTGDRQTADEVVQDVFQNVWQAAGGFQPNLGSVVGWLTGIARHRAIDATRSRREKRRAAERPLDESQAMPDEGSLELEIDRRELRDVVRRALGELPANQRQTIELAYYSGLTRSEIAARLGEPLGTVKTRLRLGLLKLRDLLRTLEPTDEIDI
jgi:RNA polymerase sigma-70 factor (ECF subfamily)